MSTRAHQKAAGDANWRLERVALPNGVGLDVATQGRPDGVPVLLLHGYTDSWRSYEGMLPYLPPELRVVAPTQRGHGDSDRPSGYRVADFAGDAVALMDTLGIGSAAIVGHSMGSLVAQRLALDHPDRVDGLVLIGAFMGLTDNLGAHELGQAVDQLADPVDPAFVRAFQCGTIARPVPPAYLETIIAESCKLPARIWQAVIRNLLQTDLAPELPRVAAPVLLLWGDQDVFCARQEQDAFLRTLRQARLIAYAGAGHSPQWEAPTEIAAEIAAFATSVRRER